MLDRRASIRYDQCMHKWFKRLYIPTLLAIVTVGVFSILKWGWEPAPVQVMKPSFFSTPEQIGAVLFRRFYSPVVEARRIALGVAPQPEWNLHVVEGFLRAAHAEKAPIEVLIAEERMPLPDQRDLEGTELIAMPTNSDSLANLVATLERTRGKRTLIYLPSVFSTHLLMDTVVGRIEQETGERILSITVMPLALRPDQEHLIDPPCVGSERDGTGTAKLGCEVLRAGRWLYRKKLSQDQWVAVINSPKPEDYLLMISLPGQDKANDGSRAN